MKCKIMLPAALLAAAIAGSGQNVRQEVHVIPATPAVPADPMMMMHHDKMATFQWIGAGSADGKVLKNAPYSGEVTTETTRVLGDGTRIVNRDSAMVARDKEGRTRRETNLSNIGPFADQTAQAPRFVTITDPVAKEVYILNLNEKTVQKMKMGEPATFFRTESSNGNSRQTTETFEMKIERRGVGGVAGGGPVAVGGLMAGTAVAGPGGPDNFTYAAGPMMTTAVRVPFDSKNVKTENLGNQTMEGVAVRGTRTSNTIPSGEIGNDRAITSTSERWFSEELQMTVFSKTNDPQFGETVYRVNGLQRTEPDPALFKVPAEFKVLERKGPEPMMLRRKIVESGSTDKF